MYTTSLGRIVNRTPRLEVPLEALEALEASGTTFSRRYKDDILLIIQWPNRRR